MNKILLFLLLTLELCATPLIIAHRGASGYLPEHTLEGMSLAYGLGADYIELDIVLTKNRKAIVLHDIVLDRTTDVAIKFPNRHRDDGHYYAIDFTLKEIKTLRVHERFNPKTKGRIYPNRFSGATCPFTIPTLQESIELIYGLNRTMRRDVGLYIEIKHPHFHRREGYDITRRVVELLEDNGLESESDSVYLQCFDFQTIKRLAGMSALKRIMLIGENSWNEAPKSHSDFDYLKTPKGLLEITRYAHGIGPHAPQLYQIVNSQKEPSRFYHSAKDAGLLIHPYTFRKDALPDAFHNFTEYVYYFSHILKVDGLFTDFVDDAKRIAHYP